MLFLNTIYLAVKHSRPLIQNHRAGVWSNVQNHISQQSFRAISSRLSDEQERTLSTIPDKPKRPPGIYLRFVKLVEPELIKKHPNAKRKEIIKTATTMYKNVDKETLLKLQNEYSNDLEQYNNNMRAYESKLTDTQKDALDALKFSDKQEKARRELKKQIKETNKPKKPLNAYMLYAQKKRAEGPCPDNLLEWSKKIGQEWKTLSEEEKKKYVKKSEELKKAYEIEISKWETSLEDTKYSHLIKIHKKSDQKSDSTKSESKQPKSRKSKRSDAVSAEKVTYSHSEADSINKTAISKTSSRKKNFQASASDSGDKNTRINSDLNRTPDYHTRSEKNSNFESNKLNKIICLINSFLTDGTAVIIIRVTLASVFFVLPLFYFFCLR